MKKTKTKDEHAQLIVGVSYEKNKYDKIYSIRQFCYPLKLPLSPSATHRDDIYLRG